MVACGFDAADCLPFTDPWEACPRSASCRFHFLDGVCNVECNSAECLYDGGDCFPAQPACERVEVCSQGVEDGSCDPSCNSPQCPYDGVDCSLGTTDFVSPASHVHCPLSLLTCMWPQADDVLVLILYADRNRPFTKPWREEFLANLSRLLNSIPVLLGVQELSPEDLKKLGLSPPSSQQL